MTILAAIDLREATGVVLAAAHRHARTFGEDLIVCHVGRTSEAVISEIAARVHVETGRASNEFETIVLPGTPAHEILRAAQWSSVDLVVMGSPHHTGLSRLFHRCTLRRVLRRASAPVLVARDSPRTGQIVVASDLLDGRFPELAITAREAVLFGTGTQITALHCVDTPSHESTIGEGDAWMEELPPRYCAHVQWARETLQLALQLNQVEAEQQVVLGPIRKTILAAATSYGAELVVIGNHHHGRVERMSEGAVCEHVAAVAPCSVLIVPVVVSEAPPAIRRTPVFDQL